MKIRTKQTTTYQIDGDDREFTSLEEANARAKELAIRDFCKQHHIGVGEGWSPAIIAETLIEHQKQLFSILSGTAVKLAPWEDPKP